MPWSGAPDVASTQNRRNEPPSMKMKVLIIEDEYPMRKVLSLCLRQRGYEVKTAADGVEGMALWEAWDPDLVLTDMKMPRAGGMEVLAFKNERRLRAPLIMLTAFGTIDSAVEAMKRGACDYLTKPFDNEKVVKIAEKALDERAEEEPESAVAGKDTDETPLLGSSEPMRRVLVEIDVASGTDASVLITGESGTGKELVAREIHRRGKRHRGKLIRVNCAAIPRDLLESELFGHKKGAFTGAVEDRDGSFVRADGGTLFLDEIGDLPLGLQPKLLHAVEEKVVTPIGASEEIRVDVKVVAATNRDITAMVEERAFRDDLYYRLNTFHIHVAPLRERRKDVGELASFYLERFTRAHRRGLIAWDEDALALLEAHDWPGNVRELKNLVEKLVLSCRGDWIGPDDLPPLLRAASSRGKRSASTGHFDLEGQEKELIARALEKTGGNQVRAAALLNISRNTLRYRMKKYGLRATNPDPRSEHG